MGYLGALWILLIYTSLSLCENYHRVDGINGKLIDTFNMTWNNQCFHSCNNYRNSCGYVLLQGFVYTDRSIHDRLLCSLYKQTNEIIDIQNYETENSINKNEYEYKMMAYKKDKQACNESSTTNGNELKTVVTLSTMKEASASTTHLESTSSADSAPESTLQTKSSSLITSDSTTESSSMTSVSSTEPSSTLATTDTLTNNPSTTTHGSTAEATTLVFNTSTASTSTTHANTEETTTLVATTSTALPSTSTLPTTNIPSTTSDTTTIDTTTTSVRSITTELKTTTEITTPEKSTSLSTTTETTSTDTSSVSDSTSHITSSAATNATIFPTTTLLTSSTSKQSPTCDPFSYIYQYQIKATSIFTYSDVVLNEDGLICTKKLIFFSECQTHIDDDCNFQSVTVTSDHTRLDDASDDKPTNAYYSMTSCDLASGGSPTQIYANPNSNGVDYGTFAPEANRYIPVPRILYVPKIFSGCGKSDDE